MRSGFAAFLLAFSLAVSHAQDVPEHNITISGNITDSVTGRGISGALVTLQAGPSKAEIAAMRAQLEQGGDAVNLKPFSVSAPRRIVTDENGKYSFTR